jgi:hypothetical protein
MLMVMMLAHVMFALFAMDMAALFETVLLASGFLGHMRSAAGIGFTMSPAHGFLRNPALETKIIVFLAIMGLVRSLVPAAMSVMVLGMAMLVVSMVSTLMPVGHHLSPFRSY